MLRVTKAILPLRPHLTPKLTYLRQFSVTGGENSGEEWNDAWETAWLPNDLSNKTPPWESDVSMTSITTDAETKAFVDEMNENWDQRRKGFKKQHDTRKGGDDNVGLYELGRLKSDYRLKKHRVHGGLWLKEIEKLEESRLSGGSGGGGDDDIEKLLDSCSEIFDSPNNDLTNPKVPSTSEFKNKPDGWETTSKSEDGSVWDMSQREEDILVQEFERRMAFCKFQIASFIKTHIFSRRRPIDGWKYMIEVIGPNAKKGKGSVSRMPGLADPATQPFTEDRPHSSPRRLSSSRSR